MYKQYYELNNVLDAGIGKLDDLGNIKYYIPNDPANTDWQAYQKWLTELDGEGNPNQPLPAE